MSALSPWVYAVGTSYAALAVIIFRLARKPSCRICLNRSYCPNRLAGAEQFLRLPRCIAPKQTDDLRPLEDR